MDRREEVQALKEALLDLRDRLKEAEERAYQAELELKKERLRNMPEPDLRMASEFTKSDYMLGKSRNRA